MTRILFVCHIIITAILPCAGTSCAVLCGNLFHEGEGIIGIHEDADTVTAANGEQHLRCKADVVSRVPEIFHPVTDLNITAKPRFPKVGSRLGIGRYHLLDKPLRNDACFSPQDLLQMDPKFSEI